MCGPEGLYPVCYVRCDSDCGDVAPAKGRGRCQSKNACEEHRQNATGNGIEGRTPQGINTQNPDVENDSKDVVNTSNENSDTVFELPSYDATEGMNNMSHSSTLFILSLAH